MPTQQTSVTSETGRDAVAPDAAVAVLRDAFSEKEAAGPPIALTPGGLNLLQRYWRAFRQWRQREGLRVRLTNMTDRELMDIGLTPGDINYIVAERAIEKLRDGTAYLWPSRGGM